MVKTSDSYFSASTVQNATCPLKAGESSGGNSVARFQHSSPRFRLSRNTAGTNSSRMVAAVGTTDHIDSAFASTMAFRSAVLLNGNVWGAPAMVAPAHTSTRHGSTRPYQQLGRFNCELFLRKRSIASRRLISSSNNQYQYLLEQVFCVGECSHCQYPCERVSAVYCPYTNFLANRVRKRLQKVNISASDNGERQGPARNRSGPKFSLAVSLFANLVLWPFLHKYELVPEGPQSC
jgi:hypothetical protein